MKNPCPLDLISASSTLYVECSQVVSRPATEAPDSAWFSTEYYLRLSYFRHPFDVFSPTRLVMFSQLDNILLFIYIVDLVIHATPPKGSFFFISKYCSHLTLKKHELSGRLLLCPSLVIAQSNYGSSAGYWEVVESHFVAGKTLFHSAGIEFH